MLFEKEINKTKGSRNEVQFLEFLRSWVGVLSEVFLKDNFLFLCQNSPFLALKLKLEQIGKIKRNLVSFDFPDFKELLSLEFEPINDFVDGDEELLGEVFILDFVGVGILEKRGFRKIFEV